MQAEGKSNGGISSMLHSKQLLPLLSIMHSLAAICLRDLSECFYSVAHCSKLFTLTVVLLQGLYARRSENSYTQLKQDDFSGTGSKE